MIITLIDIGAMGTVQEKVERTGNAIKNRDHRDKDFSKSILNTKESRYEQNNIKKLRYIYIYYTYIYIYIYIYEEIDR